MKEEHLFRYKAVIDFIEFTFTTTSNTNAFSIKRNMGLSYVTPLNKGPGAAANQFSCRVYDIKNWAKLEADISRLKNKYQISGEPVITAVEVSLDAYANGASYDQMIEHVAHFFCMLANPVSPNRRFSRAYKGSSEGLHGRSYTINRLKKGGAIYIGSQNTDSKSMRIYYKTTDKEELLKPEECRARIEITLTGQDCPFSTLTEARNYNFTELRDYFRFTELKDNLGRFDSDLADRIPIVGERRPRRRMGGGGYLIYSRLVIPDAKLNEIVYDQLRNLTKRLNTHKMRKTR